MEPRDQTLCAEGSAETSLSSADLRRLVYATLDRLGARHRVLIVPPDATRAHSRAGELTRYAWEYYGSALAAILPALGTHAPMTDGQIGSMFGDIPRELFHAHDWRNDIVTLGEVPESYVKEVSGGRVSYPWPAQVNRLLVEGGFDLILSVGQVVPHEVAGMANHAKNIFVGTGGRQGIDRSHFLGAVCGMENLMGRADTPVRRVFNYAGEHFAGGIPIVYALTVMSSDGNHVRGLFAGNGTSCFRDAAALSAKVNVFSLPQSPRTIVVYLDPSEYHSTWLGNKAIYRTRMAVASGGEVIVLAPGVERFGEDPTIDLLIRRHGYRGTDAALAAVKKDSELAENLSAAAHLIHGSSEGRFTVTYCPGKLSRSEIEGVGFAFGDLEGMLRRYDPLKLTSGPNRLGNGEEFFFVPNPGLGLWAALERWG